MTICVVGAGVSGLTAALRLQEAGQRVRVLEAAAHPGGRTWSVVAGGHRLDIGTHMLLGCFERVRALVEQLQLGERWFEVQGGPGGGVLHDHTLSSFSPKHAFDVLRFQGISMSGRLRLLRAFIAAERHRGELDFFDLSLGEDDPDDRDCDRFAREELGDEAADYVVDCFIRTFHFHGARKMGARYFRALATLLIEHGDDFRVCALRGHLGALPSALAARLDVHYGVEVTRIAAHPGAVDVTTDSGVERFSHVVLATPAEQALAMVPEPTCAQRAVLGAAASSSTIYLAFEVPCAVAGDFQGIWVPYVESKVVSGLANDRPLEDAACSHTVFNVWLHEEAAAALWHEPDGEVFRQVQAELERLFPHYRGALGPLYLRRWPQALPIYSAAQIRRVREFWRRGQGEQGLWLCGDYLNHPWLEGAVRCGEKLAQLIVQS